MKYTMNNLHTSSGISHFHVQDPPPKHRRRCALLAPITSFLLEIVYRGMYKRIEKSCLEMVQGKQQALTGDSGE